MQPGIPIGEGARDHCRQRLGLVVLEGMALMVQVVNQSRKSSEAMGLPVCRVSATILVHHFRETAPSAKASLLMLLRILFRRMVYCPCCYLLLFATL